MTTPPTNRPLAVVCGSLTRAYPEMTTVAWHLAAAAWRVIRPTPCPADHTPTPADVDAIIAGYYRDIDAADLVIVVAPDGRVGEQTGREVTRAEAAGKPIWWVLSPGGVVELIADIRAGRLTPNTQTA